MDVSQARRPKALEDENARLKKLLVTAPMAHQTARVAAAFGIVLLFTPVRWPPSKGMSQALVKTLKRNFAFAAVAPEA